MIPLPIRKGMIDRDEGAMSICNQCELLSLAGSTLYYTPSQASGKDLMMEELDRLNTEDTKRGTRSMAAELNKKGHKSGWCHVRTLMRIMRLKIVYCCPLTTVIDPAKYKYPNLLRNLDKTS